MYGTVFLPYMTTINSIGFVCCNVVKMLDCKIKSDLCCGWVGDRAGKVYIMCNKLYDKQLLPS